MQITIIRLLKGEVRSGKYCAPHYFLVPGSNAGNLMLGLGLMLTGKRNNIENQWKLDSTLKIKIFISTFLFMENTYEIFSFKLDLQ